MPPLSGGGLRDLGPRMGLYAGPLLQRTSPEGIGAACGARRDPTMRGLRRGTATTMEVTPLGRLPPDPRTLEGLLVSEDEVPTIGRRCARPGCGRPVPPRPPGPGRPRRYCSPACYLAVKLHGR